MAGKGHWRISIFRIRTTSWISSERITSLIDTFYPLKSAAMAQKEQDECYSTVKVVDAKKIDAARDKIEF